MNNIKLGSSQNNINIFTNKNISLNTNNNQNDISNYFDKNNSEKNNNFLASHHNLDNTNQKLNFNFNFNFPTDECQKFLNRKRQANEKKKNKNFNVNLNLNVNLNTSNNQLNNINNSFNSEIFNRYKCSDTLRSLRENKSLSSKAFETKNNILYTNNIINSPSIHNEINSFDKKIKFLNLKTRSSNNLLKDSFCKKYLGDDGMIENDLFQKKSSFDFQKYSNNFQNQRNKKLFGSNINSESRNNNKLVSLKNEFKFDFDILNVNFKLDNFFLLDFWNNE